MHVFAVGDDGASQRRSYPSWQGSDGFQGGWERVDALDLMGNVEQLARRGDRAPRRPPLPRPARAI